MPKEPKVIDSYNQLKAFLQTVQDTTYSSVVAKQELPMHFNRIVEDLSVLAEMDLDTYKLPEQSNTHLNLFMVKGETLRAKINSIYHFEEWKPVVKEANAPTPNDTPTITISQHNSNEANQVVVQTMTVDLTEVLTKAEGSVAEGSDESKFIQKVKTGLKTAKSAADILMLILGTAQAYGLSLDTLQKIFSHH